MKKNEKDPISASEINKFIYCPYQWYYERLYGAKEIRRLYQERNAAYGYEDQTQANFVKGQAFHNGYLEKDRSSGRIKAVFFSACVLLGALCGLAFYFFVLR